MKPERIIEEMARLEGWRKQENERSGWTGLVHSDCKLKFPVYLSDHNAVQRVIDGLDNTRLSRYVHVLSKMFIPHGQIAGNYFIHEQIHKATPAQKCEAILKATGKWED